MSESPTIDVPAEVLVDPVDHEAMVAEKRSAAIRLSCLIVGTIGIISSVVLVRDPSIGFTLTGSSIIALAIALGGSGTWDTRREWPHLIAMALSALAAFGLCASACGTHKYYQDVLGIPTTIVGMSVHALIVLAIVLQRRLAPERTLGADLAIAVGVGGSLFFGAVLAIHQSWCGACIAIHGLMVLQLIELIINRSEGVYRAAMVATALAGAGALNASYHHREIPATRNDPDELLAYLRSAWTSQLPPRPVIQDTGDARLSPTVREPAIAPAVKQDRLVTPPVENIDQSSPLQPILNTPQVAPDAATSNRSLADANRWGSPTAKIALLVGIDPGCPHCAMQFPEVLQLKDLVDKGVIQVRFLLGYENDIGQAMASVSYAAGIHSEQALLDTLQAFFRNQGKLLTNADVIQALPESFPRDQAIGIVRGQNTEISKLLVDAAKLKQQFGSTGDPTIWVCVAGNATPSRKLSGVNMASVLRVAISSVIP